jgi:phage-related protein (TIGR01555 family)
LIALRPVEAMWCYPTNYNATDPLKKDWYNPETWFVMSREVHRSRLLTFVGREVPDQLKPSYAFGGLAMSQMAKPYVDYWLRMRTSVSDIVNNFSILGLSTNLGESLGVAGDQLFKRAELFNAARDNQGLMILQNGAEPDKEEFFNVVTPLSTLDDLLAQSQEHMSAVSGIPLVKLLGIQPKGLNASSEGEIRTFYDGIEAYQEKFFRDKLTVVIGMIQLSLWGKVDEDIVFEFQKLFSLTEKEAAEVREIEARTGDIYIGSGTLWPKDERKRVANDPNTPYPGLDIEDLPDLEDVPDINVRGTGNPLKLQGGGDPNKPGAKKPGELDEEKDEQEGEERAA